MWPGQSGKMYMLNELHRTNSLSALHNIENFNSSRTTNYQKTLFRFPLRSSPSALSEKTYNVASILELTDVLRDEAKFLLIFLRSIHTITVTEISRSGSRKLLFQVRVTPAYQDTLTQQRTSFMSRLHTAHSLSPFRISSCISDVTEFSIEIKDATNHQSKTISWLVASQVGCDDRNVVEAAQRQRTFPWVGAAIEIDEDIDFSTLFKGRLFCFLPMPVETSSELPVHVNGTFGLNDDRRTIKWPEGERRNDPTAQWNQMLVRDCLPSCYNHLLKTAVRKNLISFSLLYQTLPNISLLHHSQWNLLLGPLYEGLFQWKCLWANHFKEWIASKDATTIPDSHTLPKIVKLILKAGGVKVVEIPDHVSKALRKYYSGRVTTVTPALVRNVLRAKPSIYRSKTQRDKLELLRFCLSDNDVSDLNDLELIPLADDTFKKFSSAERRKNSYLYLCSEKFPRQLLPNLDHVLVNVTDADLHRSLSRVADHFYTQLVKLELCNIVSLLPCSFPRSWQGKTVVTISLFRQNQGFPSQWFQLFWDWVQNYDLSKFVNMPVVPIVTDNAYHEMTVANLTTQSPLVIVQRDECSWEMLVILQKLGVHCTFQRHVSYLQHRQLFQHINTFTAKGVLTAISNSSIDSSSVTLDHKECAKLQSFLSSLLLSDFTSSQSNVLSHLRIFNLLNNNEYLSLHVAAQRSWNGRLIVVPSEFTFDEKCLPSNLVLLSRGNNQLSLLKAFSISNINITFPQSQLRFIIDELIPMIESNHCPHSSINSLMEHVLQLIPIYKKKYQPRVFHELTLKLSSLRFVPVNVLGERRAPQELYDLSKPELRALFHEKHLFPRPPFDDREYLKQLRECNLRTNIEGNVLLSLVNEIAVNRKTSLKPQSVSKLHLSQAKAILSYIRKVPDILNERVIFPQGTSQTPTLGNVLNTMSTNMCWLPICASCPDDYNEYLPWKGSSCSSHLTSLTQSVLLCSGEDLESLPHLVGSQMYIVDCPSVLCKVLCTQNPPIKAVLEHFKLVIETQRDIKTSDLDEQVHEVYNYLQRNIDAVHRSCNTSELCSQNLIWLKRQHKFVSPNVVVLHENPTFTNTSCLYPYYIKLPESLESYARLLTHFGIQERLSVSNIVSVLRMIKDDRQVQSTKKAWETVDQILKWITDDGSKYAHDKLADNDILFVPTDSRSLCLKNVKKVVYCDLHYLKSFENIDKSVHFLHSRFLRLAPFLGAKSLTNHLNLSQDAFGDVGQHEPLVTRLQNILRDYQGDLTIIKELLQNADDAGATEMTICYDSRTHSVEPSSLIFPGMADCHGPALLVHNNASFTDEDFENITKLAGATKMNKPLKIGKFGVGFCSVYHITDIPSFISGKWLYIFDPTISYLKNEIKDRSRPGKKLEFTSEFVNLSKQLTPYNNMFGFVPSKAYRGTIFRLPLRSSTSEISHTIYNKKKVNHLLNNVKTAGSKLLLFLNNLKCIKVSRFDERSRKPTVLWCFEKSIIYKIPLDGHQSDRNDGESVICQIDAQDKVQESSKCQEWWLVSHCRHHGSQDDAAFSSASVACSLHNRRSKSYSPKCIEGEVFCYLPLALKTGLPVHVSANFAVLGDRSGIHASDNDGTKDEVQWNITLMKTVVPQAYFTLLMALQQLCSRGMVIDYKYYSLWPLKVSLEVHNPWSQILDKLYKSISTSKLFCSASHSRWVQLRDARILSPNILSLYSNKRSSPACVIETAKELGYVRIDLPQCYQCCLPLEIIKTCLVNENEFVRDFFENIGKISERIVIDVLFFCFKLYNYDTPGGTSIEHYLMKTKCVPCSPDGKCLKKCSDIVDPNANFSCLYDKYDEVFPPERFYSDKHVRSSMRELGMVHSLLPTPMILERVKTIATLSPKNKKTALKKTVVLLQCITCVLSNNDHKKVLLSKQKELERVEFLPVMERPQHYPECLQWCGQGHTFLCGRALVKDMESTALVAGSQVCIVNESELQSGGCGQIPTETAQALGITSLPSCDSVIKHLIHIESVYSQTKSKSAMRKWVESACEQIYNHLDFHIYNKEIHNEDLKQLMNSKSLWTGRNFVSPKCVAKGWDCKGPYLYGVPYMLKSKANLIEAMQFRETFSLEDFLQALEQSYKENQGKTISNKKELFKTVLEMLNELANILSSNELTLFEDQVCYIPDEEGVMRKMSDLAYNDAPWCQVSQDVYFVHKKVARDIAIQLGVTPIRSKALKQYESSQQHFDGVPFGQREKLTQRIKNILEEYPQGITVLKELLQNADDARATKMYVILDKRTHGTNKLPSNEWQDLQGPALLVWNDSSFSEQDLKGIQELGLGSKRSSPETIGQFGIGFNVVYHLTDCPSFLTNGDTLCVFDPHCRYVPEADESNPGRRYDGLDNGFWRNYSDLEQSYLRRGVLQGCPEEVQNSGTLFRFPLRHTLELVQQSELVCCRELSRIESNDAPMTSRVMEDNLTSWFPKLKEAILFLNNITELKLYIIDNRTMTLTHHYAAQLRGDAVEERKKFLVKLNSFVENREPTVIKYSMFLNEHVPQKCIDSWIIQLGIGDVQNPQQHWEYLPRRKPRHGLALPLRRNRVTFTGGLFCFLPLPSLSHLPVHVNGDFVLDSARSGLWKTRDSTDTDERHKWNRQILEAIAYSYIELLIACRGEFFSAEVCNSPQEAIKKYYDVFPRWLENHVLDKDMQFLACNIYKKLSELNSPVFIMRIEESNSFQNFQAEWLQASAADNPSRQVHFWDGQPQVGSRLPSILSRIGMNLTAAPMFIRNHFEKCGTELPIADPETVYSYYCSFFSQVSETFPCPVTQTKFRSVEDFIRFVNYIKQRDTSNEVVSNSFIFPTPPDGIPLLLTSNEVLCCFSDVKVINSAFSYIFAVECGDRFLHYKMHEQNLTQKYFIQPERNNWDMVSSILQATLPESLAAQKVENADGHIDIENLLSPIWKCLESDEVFRVYFKQIVKDWALFLTTENELFAYKSDEQLLPIVPVRRSRQGPPPFNNHSEKSLSTNVFKILKKYGMPILNKSVVTLRLCETICPQISEVQKVLTNLVHLYEQCGLQSLATDEIEVLFNYFAKIHFAREQDNLAKVKSLPLFRDICGRYCTLFGRNVYIWPLHSIPLEAGREKWIEQTSAVFLHPTDIWTRLGQPSALGLAEISPLLIYIRFIFPHFHLLSDDERMAHLKLIRDTESLFNTANSRAKISGKNNEDVILCTNFISALKKLPCLLKKGELRPVSDFCDPSKPILGLFLSDESFPPNYLTDDKWLGFLRKLGLRTKPSMEEFVNFCMRVAEGKQRHIKESSQALMKFLFENSSWHSEVEFLNNVSTIPFVCAIRLQELSWIVPAASADVTIQEGSKTFHLTSLSKAASSEVQNILWTVKPVVYLPYGNFHPLEESDKKEQFLRCIKVVRKPSIDEVIRNIKAISSSRFRNFKLFDHSDNDCIPPKMREDLLFNVIVECFEYLKAAGCSKEEVCCLQKCPCIPVTTAESDVLSSVSVTVLVNPLRVVASTDSDGTVKKLAPFLNILSDGLYPVLPDVLSKLGVTTEIQYCNLRNALEIMYHHIEKPLDPNSIEVVKLIIKKLYSIEVPQGMKNPLYLPNERRELIESTKLLYDDSGRYKKAHFNTEQLPYSFISLFTHSHQERSEYGFTLKELVLHLPSEIRPLSLSTHCLEMLGSGCHPEERATELTSRLKEAFRFQDFSKVIQMILMASQVEKEVCERFAESLSDFCSTVKVYTVMTLNVDVHLTLSDLPVHIGTAMVDFTLVHSRESESFVLYVNNAARFKRNLVDSLSRSIVTTVTDMRGMDVEKIAGHVDLEKAISILLEGPSKEEIDDLLDDFGVTANNSEIRDSSLNMKFSVKLGSPIPEHLHYRLHADIHNVFRPHEIVGYEVCDNYYIFARVCYRVAEGEDGELDKYFIAISEDDEDGIEVTLIEICKILRMKDIQKDSGSREIILYDPEADNVTMWETFKGDSLNSILITVYEELKKIWKIKDKDLRQKALKAMYLKWHPDKSSSPFATKVFQYLRRQIERLKEGKDLEDPEKGCSNSGENNSDLWRNWDDIVRSRSEQWRNEQTRRRENPSMPTSDDLDEELRNKSVSPDPFRAQVWLKQAKHDMTALLVLVKEIRAKREVCAHVCFMAHQVAEKVLKAGMYKLIGLDPNLLRWHQLVGHAGAIEQIKPHEAAGLRALVRSLESHYLAPRYPNRYSPVKVPSEQYTAEDALLAELTAINVLNTVKKIF